MRTDCVLSVEATCDGEKVREDEAWAVEESSEESDASVVKEGEEEEEETLSVEGTVCVRNEGCVEGLSCDRADDGCMREEESSVEEVVGDGNRTPVEEGPCGGNEDVTGEENCDRAVVCVASDRRELAAKEVGVSPLIEPVSADSVD
jgi:hypothetical protein